MNPQHISKPLSDLLKALGIQKRVREHQVLLYWKEAVGKTVSQITEPQSIKGGKIFVKVKNSAWRHELFYHKQEIIEKINSRFGKRVIRDIILI